MYPSSTNSENPSNFILYFRCTLKSQVLTDSLIMRKFVLKITELLLVPAALYVFIWGYCAACADAFACPVFKSAIQWGWSEFCVSPSMGINMFIRYCISWPWNMTVCAGLTALPGGAKFPDSAGAFHYEESGKLLSVTSNRFIHWWVISVFSHCHYSTGLSVVASGLLDLQHSLAAWPWPVFGCAASA